MSMVLDTTKSAEACNFSKSNTPPWVVFTFLKLHKWSQIAQRTTSSFGIQQWLPFHIWFIMAFDYKMTCYRCPFALLPMLYLKSDMRLDIRLAYHI